MAQTEPDKQDHAGSLISMVGVLIEQQGGINGLWNKFQNQGIGEIFKSWVGTGNNMNVTIQQLTAVIGQEKIDALAQKFGVSPAEITQRLSSYLPLVIDKMTPGGQVAENSKQGSTS